MSTRSFRRAALLALLPAVFTACDQDAAAPVLPPASTLSATGPLALDWHEQARALVAANRLNALAGGRLYAALGVAQHRAVLKVDELLVHDGPERGRRYEAQRGAVAGASARVLIWFFPSAVAEIDKKLAAHVKTSSGEGRAHFKRGMEIGRAAGNAMVQHVQNDGFTAPWTGTVPTGPGMWIPGALPPGGVMLGGVKPYFLTTGSQFRAAPPPALGTTAFNTDLAEVRTLTDNITSEQLAFARYWDFPLGTFNPIGYWNNTAAQYVEQYKVDEATAAHVFALTHAATFDALIACWEAKYHYWFLRPTHADPSISLAFTLPNFPSYPSGHSCASAAAARVLTRFFPDRAGELANMVDDAGLSRILAGIHYRFDITAGQQLGRTVAEWAISRDGR